MRNHCEACGQLPEVDDEAKPCTAGCGRFICHCCHDDDGNCFACKLNTQTGDRQLIKECRAGIGMTARNVPKVMNEDKRQTRRIEAALRKLVSYSGGEKKTDGNGTVYFSFCCGLSIARVEPNYRVGDKLYIKEALKKRSAGGVDIAVYKADSLGVGDRRNGNDGFRLRKWESDNGKPWKVDVLPARYMPKTAARTFIEITDVRCERVNNITWQDVKAEGCSLHGIVSQGANKNIDAASRFSELWDDTNGKGAWERNDWVFAYTFKLLKPSLNPTNGSLFF